MANFFSLRVLFAHLLAFLDVLQRSFWDHAPQPLLSAIFPLLLEADPKSSPALHLPRVLDLPGYTNPVDLSTMCLLPMIFRAPSTIDTTCNVNHLDYDQDDASPSEPESLRFYDFLDDSIPVPREEEPSALAQSEQVEANHTQTNLASYGTRGLSFCPVLVGVTYLHSLLHLYMLLMIPSLINHWFEDGSVYESLDPPELLDCPRLLHTSLLMAPLCLARYGLLKALLHLYRRLRRVTHKSTHASIPRIVLIRVDGEAVPVHFVEDHQEKADVRVDVRQAFESEDLATQSDRDDVSDGGDLEDVAQSNPSDDDGFTTTKFGRPLISTVSQQGELQGGIVNSHDDVGSGPFTANVTKDSRDFENVSVIPNEKRETFPDPVQVGSEPLRHIVEWDDFEQIVFPEGIFDDDPLENSDSLGEQEDSNQHIRFGPISDSGPYELETSSATPGPSSPSVESQDTPTPAKSVRFTNMKVDVTDGWQEVSSVAPIEESVGACNLEDDDYAQTDLPMVLFDPLMETKSPLQVTEPILPVVPSDEEGNDISFVEPLSPFLTEEPVVNLPAMVVTREGTELVDMDPMIHAVLVEDVATLSPLQLPGPTVPAVVINIGCSAGEEQSLTMGTGELERGTIEPEENLNEETVGVTSDVVSILEDGPWPPSPYIEWSPPIGDVRPMELALLASTSLSETGVSLACPGLVEAEVTYEVPKLEGPDDKDLPSSPRNAQGPEASRLEMTAETRAATADTLVESGTEDIVSGQPLDSSRAIETESPTTQPPERTSVPLDTSEDVVLLSTTSTDKRTDELLHGKSHKDGAALWDLLTTTSQPCHQQTPPGSMHTPIDSDLLSIPRVNSYIDQASIIYDSFPPARSKEAKGSTVTGSASERVQDLFASIHAPQKTSNSEVPALDSESRSRYGRDHCRSVTSPVAASEDEPLTSPSSPNWGAMPDVVDAFCMFRQAQGANGIRRASSISECTSRGPMAGIVGQKGVATNSLNNTSTIANIQGRWMRGGGLLLVRDLVPSDPADFNLRTCTTMGTSKVCSMNASRIQPGLCPGMLDISPFLSQQEKTRQLAGAEADFSSMVADSAEFQQQPSMLALHARRK